VNVENELIERLLSTRFLFKSKKIMTGAFNLHDISTEFGVKNSKIVA
jgi:hypothetical protein